MQMKRISEEPAPDEADICARKRLANHRAQKLQEMFKEIFNIWHP